MVQLESRPTGIIDVKSNRRTLIQASEFYGISKSTIGDKAKSIQDKNPEQQP